MLALLQAQRDYLSFLTGLGCLFVFLLGLTLRRHPQFPRSFIWLGFFALCQCCFEWFSLIMPVLGGPVLSERLKLLQLLANVVFLTEFGVSIILPLKWRVWGRALAGLYLVGLIASAWVGLSQVWLPAAVIARLATSIWTIVALWQVAISTKSGILHGAALSLAGLLLSQALPLYPGIVPWQNWEQYFMAAPDIIQMSVLRSLFSLCLALTLWIYYQNQLWQRTAEVAALWRWPLYGSFALVLVIFLTLGIGGLATGWYGRYLDADMRQILITRVRTLASALNPEAIKQLQGNEADLGTEVYENLKKKLISIRQANGDCRFVYLMVWRSPYPVLLVDSEDVSSANYSPPGQIYYEASAELKTLLQQGQAFVKGPNSDRWGTWISGFEFIRVAITGQNLAVVGMDVDAKDWQKKIRLHRLLPLSLTLLITLLLTGLYIFQQRLFDAGRHLSESEERYRTLVEGSPDIICLLDQKWRFLAINRVGLDRLGVQEGSIPDQSFCELWPREMQSILTAAKQQVEQGRPAAFEGEMSLRGEPTSVWQVVLNPIKGKNKGGLRYVGIMTEITEKKKLEEEQARADKLESLGFLAGGIAHDFNNILAVIRGNAGLALLSLPAGSRELNNLIVIEGACLKAQSLAQQLLTFAQGGVPVKKLSDLKELIQETFIFATRGSPVRCEFNLATDLWAAEIDAGQISQVFHNLAINAVQAMPTGGAIRVQAENAVLQTSSGFSLPPGEYVKITVTDQGVGILPKYLAKVFDPYFTTKQVGSGLGLTTVFSIVKKHGGDISVQSTLGEGTAFVIHLPASLKKVSSVIPERKQVAFGHGRILVMDDQADVRETLGKMLQRLGYEVDFAEDGQEAFERYTAAHKEGRGFDAVILDLTVPGGMGGKEAQAKIKAIDPQARIIVTSGYADDPILSDYQNYGFCEAIAKPVDIVELSRVIIRAGKKK